MDSRELDTYTTKLAEVELALSADPSNSELQILKREIEDLLQLTMQLQGGEPNSTAPAVSDNKKQEEKARTQPTVNSTPTSASSEKHEWRIGDECMARYKADSQFYPARVVAVHGGDAYQVTFVGYGDMQETRGEDMTGQKRKHDEDKGSAGQKEQTQQQQRNAGGAGSLGMKHGKIEKHKSSERSKSGGGGSAATGQQAWLKFAKGGHSKKLKAKAINSHSIFKSPDTVTGKVGVSNSGKGMTKARTLSKM
ncbi:hypothetical protein GQ54DRAFT_163496 [Martensiomyces pterosporus]|nr:hypothetical protein GQ54DRAFT_163496 [Martensiomyces pterosporus]